MPNRSCELKEFWTFFCHQIQDSANKKILERNENVSNFRSAFCRWIIKAEQFETIQACLAFPYIKGWNEPKHVKLSYCYKKFIATSNSAFMRTSELEVRSLRSLGSGDKNNPIFFLTRRMMADKSIRKLNESWNVLWLPLALQRNRSGLRSCAKT